MTRVKDKKLKKEQSSGETVTAKEPESILSNKEANLMNYDAIGFEADHCLVKFDYPGLTEHRINRFCTGLKEMGYPEVIRKFCYSQFARTFGSVLKNVVWDVENGAILMLGEEKRVLFATIGFERLTKE